MRLRCQSNSNLIYTAHYFSNFLKNFYNENYTLSQTCNQMVFLNLSLGWMSLTHCCFLNKSQLLIFPLLFLIKGHSDDATKVIISTAVPTPLKSVGNRPAYLPMAVFPQVSSYWCAYHHGDISLTAHVWVVEEGI